MEERFCASCGRHRLSVEDVDGVCLFCRYPERKPQMVPVNLYGFRREKDECAVCGRKPVTHRGRCGPCNREEARQARLRRKDNDRHYADLGGGREPGAAAL